MKSKKYQTYLRKRDIHKLNVRGRKKNLQEWEKIAWKVFNWSTGVTVVNGVAIFLRKYLPDNPITLIFIVFLTLALFISAAFILIVGPINYKIFKNSFAYAITIAVIYMAFEIYFITVLI